MESSARFRRSAANTSESSEDSAISLGSGPGSGPGIFSEKYRVCTPTMYQLPLVSNVYFNPDCLGAFPQSLQDTFDGQIKPRLIDTILVPNGVLEKEEAAYDGHIELMWRAPPEHPDLRLLTVIINSPWSTNKRRSGPVPHLTTWEYAAMRCRDLVNSHPEVRIFCGPQNNGYLVHIEIMSEELEFLTRYLGVADKYLDEFSSWKPAIDEILGSFELERHFQTMTMLRMGYELPRESNPHTILITLFRECDRTRAWDSAEAEIRAYLHNQCSAPDVDVSIEWGDLSQAAVGILSPKKVNKLLYQPDAYEQKVDLGSNIGVGSYLEVPDGNATRKIQPGCGTLGGYIEYRMAGGSNWHKAALTCYHVVRPVFPGYQLINRASAPAQEYGPGPPQANSLLARLDMVGFSPTLKDRKQFIIEAPSRVLHRHTLSKVAHVLSNFEFDGNLARAANNRALKEKIETFFDHGKQHLGYPGFGSGYGRRRNGRRMDWAAIQVEGDRRGTNALHSSAKWNELLEQGEFPFDGQHPKRPTPTIRQPPQFPITPRPNAIYFGKGGVSGYFAGYINSVKSSVKINEDKHLGMGTSEELTMIKPLEMRQPAARPSDSGAWVWNENSQLVAMVFAGMRPVSGNTQDLLTYVSPIHDVFDDIKDFSGGRITEIRVANTSP